MSNQVPPNKKKILVIDDEHRIVETITYNLRAEGYTVFTAATAEEGLEQLRRRQPDLVVLDLMLPGMSGTDFLRIIRQESQVPVIILTAKTSEIDKVVNLKMGSDDYMTKPYSFAELLARIEALLRRTNQAPKIAEERAPEEIRVGDLYMNYSKRECVINGKPVNLGYKEFEILWFLASNPDKVFRRDDIMSKVWGIEGIPLDTKTVDVHIRWIRKKIEPDPENPKYIETVRGVGYKFSTHKASEN
ncbi:MAG TPA: response regulator transcription factor [Caldisericia bacterium]|nr:response regulator transcription factor [Caldisericia bacterium]